MLRYLMGINKSAVKRRETCFQKNRLLGNYLLIMQYVVYILIYVQLNKQLHLEAIEPSKLFHSHYLIYYPIYGTQITSLT